MEENSEEFFKALRDELFDICNDNECLAETLIITSDEAHYVIVDDTFYDFDRIRAFYIGVTRENDDSYTIEIAEPAGREEFNTLAKFSSSDLDECMDKIVEAIWNE